ncbi:J domain-containing protein [Heracleum sosnowskyi]|uniref:J domain-containing protein n=1 Tax=Heracleum sosnowskyi TaxID=360622 RepID=A0AAD8MKL9_9APIA|nr:J domain-containing protein [Heracleum sosnowskyi]
MECNRDEAIRARDIADRKFLAKDITGAKKFALKAQSLYPQLDGISQFLATLDVYVCSENKINGEIDWYGMLGVNPLDNEDVIRKQFRKLALMIHPDKNKAKGADGAFDLITQAWNLLSDKAKRSAYDKALQVKPRSGGSSVQPSQYGFHNFAPGSDMKVPNNSSSSTYSASHKHKPASTTVPLSRKQKPQSVPVASCKRQRVSTATDLPQELNQTTFWTECHGCKMRHEYPRMYLNCNMLCSNCREPFFSSEIASPLPSVRDSPQGPKQSTFWTACHGCRMQYEYPRMYVNCNLLCNTCREPFFSFEVAPPPAKQETSARDQKVNKSSSMSGIYKSVRPNVKF